MPGTIARVGADDATRAGRYPRSMDRRYLIGTAAIAGLAIAAFLIIGRSPEAPPIAAASFEELHGTGGKAPTIMRQHWIMRSRGSPIDAEIPLTTFGEALELRVLPEFTARPARYRVRLFRMSADDSAQNIAELGELAPDSDNFVTVFVDGARLKPGQYRLAITGDVDTDAGDKESAFILKMQARGNVSDPSATSR
jgi:hypothetical protein